MTSHVDVEDLALLAEGLLDEDEERSTRSHVAECAHCAEVLAALSDVPRILAEAPVPPLPSGMADRLDEALRAEFRERSLSHSGAPAPQDDDAGATVLPLPRRNGVTRWMPYLAAAAAGVFVLGGGAAVVNGIMSSPGTTASAPTLGNGDSAEPEAALPYRTIVVSSGTDYTESALPEQGARLIERSPLAETPQIDAEGSETSPLSVTSEPPAEVSSCLQSLGADGSYRPALVDIAEYEGDTAWVMVDQRESGGYGLRVVSPSCGAAGDAGSAVLAEASVPAP
ncbi:hypothetical protein SAMN02745673_02718 [Marinactinospora thermotolerans DSM 45154]|uniref:Zinc-finger n=1 Tax=Marinactinospora thermotolerans DSM 45154 TaxID=1122192 RepID=A0A1T4RD45_9ACTN|nr:hypothetical protein [Marinactinospora thermotolerans]SKA13944.1 hypothetical protein SAMN02745673_02718 [Marinactinospora thermotolerans DSM 45154]